MRYRAYSRGGAPGLAANDGTGWRDLGPVQLSDLLEAGTERGPEGFATAPALDLTGLDLLPPLPRPGKILCVGLNYVDHAKESPYKDLPTYPAFFARFSTSLVADGAPIVRPRVSHELDFEGELVAIIGRTARHVPQDRALDHVAGYSIFNDASIRNYQFLGVQWTPGKNFDGTGAFGPEVVTADELPPGGHGLELEVRLNGTVMQKASTADMIFPVAELVAKASEFLTLEPGDIIVAGTPAGVGFARKPPVFMKDGDLCEVSISGIGTLRNTVRDEAHPSGEAA